MPSASWLDSGLTSGAFQRGKGAGTVRENLFQGELAESRVVEILVQAVTQPQNEGYHGESLI